MPKQAVEFSPEEEKEAKKFLDGLPKGSAQAVLYRALENYGMIGPGWRKRIQGGDDKMLKTPPKCPSCGAALSTKQL